jgi:DNA polymerase I-like protein with 3'-5' exonuclease and polymerase domains
MTVSFNMSIPLPEYIDTDDKSRVLLHTLLRKVELEPNDYIGFDTETHGKVVQLTSKKGKALDWMSDTITFWSLSTTLDGIWHRWCLRQQDFVYYAPLLENPKALLACFNAKYDAHIAWNCGINIWNARVHDGLAMANLHDENRFEHGLKAISLDYCGLKMTDFKTLFSTDKYGNKAVEYKTSLYDLDVNSVVNYASYDALAHARVCYWLKDKLAQTPMGPKSNVTMWDHFLDTEVMITEILWRMERRGLHVDREYLKSQIPVIDARIAELEKDINRTAGCPVNIQSPGQLSKLFFGTGYIPGGSGGKGMGLAPVKKTKSGGNSTDEEVLDVLADSGIELAQKVVTCRKLYKAKSTYLQSLIELSDYYEDHRIHPSFNQFGARTGRFSTREPNSQNFPRPDNDEWGVRKAFTAPPGYVLVVGDLEQAEMRIMAHVSGDGTMIKVLREGKDLHSYTVAAMNNKIKYEDVVAAKKAKEPTDEQKNLKRLRQDFKAVGFGIIYGAGAPTISEKITIEDYEIEYRRNNTDKEELRKRVKRRMKENPLLTEEKATTKVIRESIAQDKIDGYFNVFPRVKQYMEMVPQLCLENMQRDFQNKPRYRPRNEQGISVADGKTYDWDMGEWEPGSRELTRTGHAQPFGFVQTICGRYRRLEDIASKNKRNQGHAKREAINTTVQGTAADLVKGSMIRIEYHKVLMRLGVRMLNQIHDELVCEVPEGNAEQAAAIIKECLEHPFNEGQEALVVPLPADVKIVKDWASAK